MDTCIIFNPASAGGKTGATREALARACRKHFNDRFTLLDTRRPFDATRFTISAVHGGCRLIVAVGGDGTINEIVNGLLQTPLRIQSGIEIGVIASGTGGGFAQSLQLPRSMEAQLAVITHGTPRAIDVGRVVFHDREGKTGERSFVNECQIGIGAEVVRRTDPTLKRRGRGIAYGLSTLRLIFDHQHFPMDVVIDERGTIAGQMLGLTIGNGARTGGGMSLTPLARLDDGLLDVLAVYQQSVIKRLRMFSHIYSGNHISGGGCSYFTAARIAVSSGGYVPVSADGEFLGSLPAFVEIIPAAIHIRCP
jgi:diacylglycerol kinase (ATP)